MQAPAAPAAPLAASAFVASPVPVAQAPAGRAVQPPTKARGANSVVPLPGTRRVGSLPDQEDPEKSGLCHTPAAPLHVLRLPCAAHSLRSQSHCPPPRLPPTPLAAAIAKRLKELRDREGYLKNMWYAAGGHPQPRCCGLGALPLLTQPHAVAPSRCCRPSADARRPASSPCAALSNKVGKKPVKTQVCGKEMVLFRRVRRCRAAARCHARRCPCSAPSSASDALPSLLAQGRQPAQCTPSTTRAHTGAALPRQLSSVVHAPMCCCKPAVRHPFLVAACRGAPLSEGWVEHKNGHSCVVCPYHGWAMDGEGLLQGRAGESLPAAMLLSW